MRDIVIEVVVLFVQEEDLFVLLDPPARGSRVWVLPHSAIPSTGTLERVAAATAARAAGTPSVWIAQTVTVGVARTARLDPPISIAYCAVVQCGEPKDHRSHAWHAVRQLPSTSARHRALVDVALRALRDRADVSTLAQQLLPDVFTLAGLQRMHELLRGRLLGKANFRRVLSAARAVVKTGVWRQGERGRPAQPFRFAGGRKPRPWRRIPRNRGNVLFECASRPS